MAFTEDAVKAKLSALNETQDSIVSVAQWILFHRRHAPITAKIWQQRLADSQAPKRLNLVYLANEVIQQSKARKKDDFLLAFSPIIADATVTAFRGAPGDIQAKIRRVVDVWRQRAVFDPAVQQAIERDVDALEGARRKPMLGGSLLPGAGEGGVPLELKKLADLQTTLTKHSLNIRPALSSSTSEYTTLLEPPPDHKPAPLPKQAAQLGALQKSLASASDAVSASMTARKALVAELETLVAQNRAVLAEEETHTEELQRKRVAAEATRKDVEDQIMRGLGDDDDEDRPVDSLAESDRPEMEPLTPPPVESFTPPPTGPADVGDEAQTPEGEPPSILSPPPAPVAENSTVLSPGGTNSRLGGKRDSSGGFSHAGLTNGAAKRRKMSHGDEVYEGLGEDDIDDDVKGLLG